MCMKECVMEVEAYFYGIHINFYINFIIFMRHDVSFECTILIKLMKSGPCFTKLVIIKLLKSWYLIGGKQIFHRN